ncbi:RbsD/FucU family protein, partial [Bifidobacterium longum]
HVIRYDGQPIEPLLDAVLQLIPLDQYTEHPVLLMDKVPGDTVDTPIWDRYRQVIDRHEPGKQAGIGMLERFAFYEEAGRSYCIVATGEQSQYANIIIRKGVIR